MGRSREWSCASKCTLYPGGIAVKPCNTAIIQRRFKEGKTFMIAAQGGFSPVPCGAACAQVDYVRGSHSAVVLLEHISLRVIVILFVRAKKVVSVEDAPSAPLWGKINILASLRFQV